LAATRIDGSIQRRIHRPVTGDQIIMRAVVVREFGGIENASLGDMPKPAPKAGEVLLEVRAVSVNFVDLVMMSGSYQFKPPLPFIPGKLPVGVVAAIGDGVTKFKLGDHALLMAESAGFAEFAVMPESQCIKLPSALSFDEAASMALVYDTAYFALKDRGRIAPGETVLVLGATGGVGLAAIQLAKVFGAQVFAARDGACARRNRRCGPGHDSVGESDGRQGVRRGRQPGQGGHRPRRRRRRHRRSVRAGSA
jgi:NADPH:quinone reductase-like Zn-dependent oxidoreductase